MFFGNSALKCTVTFSLWRALAFLALTTPKAGSGGHFMLEAPNRRPPLKCTVINYISCFLLSGMNRRVV
ncbi:hypothetical protein X975_26010, partial [Stegodyphus mimosarum]